MISIQNIFKKYGNNTVLNISELSIPKGESFGLVGNNGAGKTTLFSILLDLIEPTTGEISIDNCIVSKSEDWKSKVTAFIDESFLISYQLPKNIFIFWAN
jgi:ABC-2 type transport system ATP-binding protein